MDLEEYCKKEGKVFRFQNQRAHVTYKTHLDKIAYTAWAKDDLKAKDVHMAHETADKHHPYLHTHVILEWNTVFQSRDPRRFDFEGIHPNIKPIVSRKQLENAYRYLTKEDTSCLYLLDILSKAFSKSVWSCKTMQDALETCERPSEVVGTIAMFNNRPKDPPYRDLIQVLRPWQECLLDELTEEPDDRNIIWIFDPIGNSGKSRLGRHIEDSGMGIAIMGCCNTRDIGLMLKNELDKRANLRIIALDLTRSFHDRDVYNLLEMLKNGQMMSGKYESCRLRWKPGHVVVFANFLPERGRCSEDRWIIHHISGSGPNVE